MKSEQINELAAALAKAQSEMLPAFKDSANPFFKSKYADLASVWDACRGPLTKHGLSVVQVMDRQDGQLILKTSLIHSSGQWIDSIAPVVPVKNDPQGVGSALTYMRRYSLAAIVGVYQDDDDGNAASGNRHQQTQMKVVDQVKEAFPSAELVSDAQSLASYKIPFGKFKGMALEAVEIKELQSYVEFIEKSAKADKKPIQGQVAEFIRAVQGYAQELKDEV
tara:strand:- start:441 stop:1106 length:666 start_codon:yes stop_codon:yes gene_type:complete